MGAGSAADGNGDVGRPGLPQKTTSICPECLEVLPAELYEREGKVWMAKRCPRHGEFVELISSDAAFFEKMDRWDWEYPAELEHQDVASKNGCPNDCGLCPSHRSRAMMINIDLTNRCNLDCPVCFANANRSGRVYEVTVEQIRRMLDASVAAYGDAPPCVQYSGGEPTVHPDFLEVLRISKEAGFAQIQAATNGLKFARDPGFARAASEAGLNVAYLQFDGVSDEVYRRTRGRPLWELKQRAVENIAGAGMQICLVPTVARGVNDHQIGAIYRFALEHIDAVAAISWQPVVFTGRIDFQQRLAMRFTNADLARCLEEQTGGEVAMDRDWYTLSFVEPFSKLVEAITGERQAAVSCHRHCGLGTYVVVGRDGRRGYPIPKFIDVEALMGRMHELAAKLGQRRWFKKLTLMRALNDLPAMFRPDQAPDGWDTRVLLDFMNAFVDFRRRYPDNTARIEDVKQTGWRYLLMVAMHFQDVYNYQLPRVQRCVIHYAAPDGRFYPFCTYNCGPNFRERVERACSRPIGASIPATAGAPAASEISAGRR
ncbi:MAG: radical SAM protein [Phycisphaerae bacterium]|nr:radical SAM protein [Phycisphaerae bacterium]